MSSMSERENPDDIGPDTSEPHSETREIIDETMSNILSGTESEPLDNVEETALKIDDSFHRMQVIINELLTAVGTAISTIEPRIKAKRQATVSSISKQLSNAGLGVFGTRAVKIVGDELESNFSFEGLFSSVFAAIEKTRVTMEQIMVNMRKVAAHNVGTSTTSLQAKLLQMHAKLTEAENQLESARMTARKWQAKSMEIEERLRQREDVLATTSVEMLQMHTSLKELNSQLSERDSAISSLRGELIQAQSHAKQQVELMHSLDSTEELTAKYDAKILELSKVQGQLTQQTELMAKKEDELTSLRERFDMLQQQKAETESQLRTASDELASLKGSERHAATEIAQMLGEVDELKARWETLYRVAEDDPTFKAYFLIADKTQWFQLPHLSSALGIPTVLLKRNLQKFVDAGLLEIDGDRVRPRSLSDIVNESKKSEEQMLQSAREEVERDDGAAPDVGFAEYTGPEKGSDYEQEGR